MHLATILTAFATVFVAELPDKTMLATIVLSARYRRPALVWTGAASALALQMVIASAAGGVLDLLPDAPVRLGIAAIFLIGAVVLWRSASHADDEAAEAEREADAAQPDAASVTPTRIVASVFGIVFLAEWGDLTQLATASLAANGRPLSVFVGAATAMVTVAGLGVVAGRALLRVMPEHLLRRLAAGIFAVLAIVAVWSALSSLATPTGDVDLSAGAAVVEFPTAPARAS